MDEQERLSVFAEALKVVHEADTARVDGGARWPLFSTGAPMAITSMRVAIEAHRDIFRLWPSAELVLRPGECIVGYIGGHEPDPGGLISGAYDVREIRDLEGCRLHPDWTVKLRFTSAGETIVLSDTPFTVTWEGWI